MIKAPCKGCEKRHAACHDSCEEYKEFKKMREEINRRRGEESSKEQIRFDTIRRIRKRSRT